MPVSLNVLVVVVAHDAREPIRAFKMAAEALKNPRLFRTIREFESSDVKVDITE